jgi:hypothetical protein
MRNLSYFPEADNTFPWLVLAAWTVSGAVMTLAGEAAQHLRRPKTRLQ